MKRVYCFLILGLGLLLVQCKFEQEQPKNDFVVEPLVDEIKVYKVTEVPFAETTAYKVKKKNENKRVQHEKITSETQFLTLFDPSEGEGDLVPIDFSKSFVLALVGMPSKIETKFSILSLKEKEEFIELKYCLDEVEEELLQKIRPFSILIIDKTFDKDVRFLME